MTSIGLWCTLYMQLKIPAVAMSYTQSPHDSSGIFLKLIRKDQFMSRRNSMPEKYLSCRTT